jgi:hypothetical protein
MWAKVWAKLVAFYNIPLVHGAVAAAEGGAYAGLATWFAMGLPLTTKQAWITLGGAVGGGIVAAVRSYFKNRPNQPAAGTGK